METRTLAMGPASWAQRKPIFAFRFVGVFLFRFADRTLCGSLFHEPPRSTKTTDPLRPGYPAQATSDNTVLRSLTESACAAWATQLCTHSRAFVTVRSPVAISSP